MNVPMLHPDGYKMCYISKKKARWYVNNQLAKYADSNEQSIQLTFAPNGPGNQNNPFYLNRRKAQCVVCGTTTALTKHHCVPKCFRKHFPVEIKSRSSHDILLLCRHCHEKYEQHGNELKQHLCNQYNVNINIYKGQRFLRMNKYVAYVKSLLKNWDSIPIEVRNQLMHNIEQLSQVKCQCYNDVVKIHQEHDVHRLPKYGKLVMDQVNDLEAFEQLWRDHFVQTMNPKYLPKFWNQGFHRGGVYNIKHEQQN